MDAEAAPVDRRDGARGIRPFLLVASAGATGAGAVDPVADLARLARAEGLLYASTPPTAGFSSSPSGPGALRRHRHADRWCSTPARGCPAHGTGILLAHNPAAVRPAHAVDGAYLQDLDADRPLPDYAELAPELTAATGVASLVPLPPSDPRLPAGPRREARSWQAWACREFSADPALELPSEPELSTMAFRLRATSRRIGTTNACSSGSTPAGASTCRAPASTGGNSCDCASSPTAPPPGHGGCGEDHRSAVAPGGPTR